MISGDEHMAARPGLMGLGPGPDRDSPPPERVRVDTTGVWGAEVKEGGQKRRNMETGVNEQKDKTQVLKIRKR